MSILQNKNFSFLGHSIIHLQSIENQIIETNLKNYYNILKGLMNNIYIHLKIRMDRQNKMFSMCTSSGSKIHKDYRKMF